MTRIWVIAPYDSTDKETFDCAWEFDKINNTIAIGWRDLGNISNYTADELRHAIEKRQSVIYTPRIWRLIMFVIRHIPDFIFNKLNI